MTLETADAPVFVNKKAMYDWLEKQVLYLVEGLSKHFTPQANLVMGLGNVAALCFYELNRFSNPGAPLETLKVNWFGFYLFQAPGVLGLGPFQGRPACMEIRVGRGVCGAVAESGESLVVPDVHVFPGHIACDSASESEVVVPILIENGCVVGVIDVDSTVREHFTEEDKEGLERVAAVLVQHLEFPMARALSVNPALGLPGYSALAGGEKALQHASETTSGAPGTVGGGDGEITKGHPVTTVTHIPAFNVEVRQAETAEETVAGWTFSSTTFNRIMTQEESQRVQDFLHISALPEIAFQCNSLTMGPASDRTRPWFNFNLEGLLRSASDYYHTEEYKKTVAPQLTIPVSEGWTTTDYEKFDPNVDWAWRNDFFGACAEEVRVVPRPTETTGINWDLLKDNTLPILFYGSLDLMEDDVHDHGMIQATVKYRVMSTAFFVLFRHVIRVDNHAIWMREVRVFHEFGLTHKSTGFPHVVLLEQWRHVSIAEPTSVEWKSLTPDAISAKAAVSLTREWTLEKAE